MTVLVTGGTGMIGHALQKVLPNGVFLSSTDVDLRNYEQTYKVFKTHNPEKVIHLAARVGGVKANTNFIAEFYKDNIDMNTNVIDISHKLGVSKVLSFLSTCIFPDNIEYPLTEATVHNGEPHSSNFGYAYAKRMLDVQSRAYRQQYGCNFITVIPNNLFGENDNFHLEHSHVIPAMIRKIYEAKINNSEVTLWGDGSPLREFTYSEDLAKIILFTLENYNGEHPLSVGNPGERSIKSVAEDVVDIFDFRGRINWQTDKPAGQHRKPSSNKKFLELGWDKKYTPFREALEKTCQWFLESYPNVRGIG